MDINALGCRFGRQAAAVEGVVAPVSREGMRLGWRAENPGSLSCLPEADAVALDGQALGHFEVSTERVEIARLGRVADLILGAQHDDGEAVGIVDGEHVILADELAVAEDGGCFGRGGIIVNMDALELGAFEVLASRLPSDTLRRRTCGAGRTSVPGARPDAARRL